MAGALTRAHAWGVYKHPGAFKHPVFFYAIYVIIYSPVCISQSNAHSRKRTQDGHPAKYPHGFPVAVLFAVCAGLRQ